MAHQSVPFPPGSLVCAERITCTGHVFTFDDYHFAEGIPKTKWVVMKDYSL